MEICRIISLDTEDTGVDFQHGTMPYIVTTCAQDTGVMFWEWDVDPITRKPLIPDGDIDSIREVISGADILALQNPKFDAHALLTVGIEMPWGRVRDTLRGGHLLASNHRHGLTEMCVEYLNHDIEPKEIAVKEATTAARKLVKQHQKTPRSPFEGWRLASEDDPDMPSVNASSKRDEDKPWKNDMWLLRAVIKQAVSVSIGADCSEFRLADIDLDVVYAVCDEYEYPRDWLTVTSEYANTDSEVTLPLWLFMEAEIKRRRYWEIYLQCLKLNRIALDMENKGVTASKLETDKLTVEYSAEAEEAAITCIAIADEYGFELELPAGAGANDSLREFFWGQCRLECPRCGTVTKHKEWTGKIPPEKETCAKCFKKSGVGTLCNVQRKSGLDLPRIYNNKSAGPTLDKDAMAEYETSLPPGQSLEFVKSLKRIRSRQKAITDMATYRRFWLPTTAPGWCRLHPSLNPTGTDHLRWSSYNPNGQNISKKEAECESCDGEGCEACGGTGVSMRSMRYCFGPMPGREWWTMDFESIERRIPAFESKEPKMMEVFLRPKEPPYWGSLYNLTASVLYPNEYWPRAQVKGLFRKERPQLYKQSKFFDLAKQYGCGRKKGDLLSKVHGSFDLVDSEFPLLAKLQAYYLHMAEKRGYVETIPDNSVDQERGYPLLASRTDDGRVLSTTPFNYHVSGTACWAKNMALIRCREQIDEWNAGGWDGFVSLEIHDEILFDMPRGTHPTEPWRNNYDKAMRLKELMAMSGDGIGIPTPVAVEYHSETWGAGLPI